MKQRGSALAILGVLVLASGSAVWKLWRNQLGGLSLKEEIAAAKREGVPLGPRDLAEPEIPDAQNAAGPYLFATSHAAAWKKAHPWSKPFDRLLSSDPRRVEIEALSPSDRARLRAEIAPYLPALVPLREAASRPKLAINRQWGEEERFEDVGGLRQLVEVLTLRARLRSFEGDVGGAFADLEDAARATALLAVGKSWYENAIRARSEATILHAVREVATRYPEDSRSPRSIRRTVALFGPPPQLRRALGSEPYSALQFTAYMANGGDSCTPGSPWLKLRSVREANEAYLISYWRYVFSRIPDDPLAFDAARSAMRDALLRYEETDSLRTQGAIVTPVEGMVMQFADQEAHRRIAMTAADVLERWQREAQIPSSLPVPRRDPFGGELRYRREADGFTVYSRGKDGGDDGGKPYQSGTRESDIVWRMTLPATIAVAKR